MKKTKIPNPEHIDMIRKMLHASPYPTLLSMKLVDIGAGFAVMELDVEEKHMQLLGAVHGGTLASPMDSVAYWSVFYSVENPDAWLTTVDLNVNFLAPVSSGKLIARGNQIKVGKKLCYATAEISDNNGTIIAHGTSTLMILTDIQLNHDLPFPPKFLD